MATYLVSEICSVCTDEFDSSHRQSVSLPCDHEFCLSCLVRLRAKGKHKCPRCRRNWAKIGLPMISGMEALANSLESDQDDDEDDVDKKKDKDDRCKKHSSPYDFWVNAKKEFYCRKCAAEDKSGVELEIIEEAIPQIQSALAADVPEAKKRLEDDLVSLDEKHANLVKKRNSVRKFSVAVKALEENFDREIEEVVAQRTKALDSSVELKKVEKKISNIKSPVDSGLAMECKNTLKRVGTPSSVRALDLLETLLSDIACSYEGGAASESPITKVSFVNAMLKGSSIGPLTEEDWSVSGSKEEKAGSRNHTMAAKKKQKSHSDSEEEEVTEKSSVAGYGSDVYSRWGSRGGVGNQPNFNNSAGGRGGGYGSNAYYTRPYNSPYPTSFMWQFLDEKGNWITYGQTSSTGYSSGRTRASSNDIERHFMITQGIQPMTIKSTTNDYILDFAKMVQFNTSTGASKPIRRVTQYHQK